MSYCKGRWVGWVGWVGKGEGGGGGGGPYLSTYGEGLAAWWGGARSAEEERFDNGDWTEATRQTGMDGDILGGRVGG